MCIQSRFRICQVAVLCCIWSLTGCASTGWLKLGGDSFPTAGVKNPVVKVLGLWQPADGTGLDNLSTRGFTGQVLFFVDGTEVPAKVDGTVRIYLFDDQGTREEQVKPIHQFDFPATAWDTHFQVTKLGPAYSIFIPYVRKGDHQAQCSLRIRYAPKKGTALHSETVNVLLPGTSPTAKSKTPPPGDQPVVQQTSAVLEIIAAGGVEPLSPPAPKPARIAKQIQAPAARVELTAAERKRIAEEFLAAQAADGTDTFARDGVPARSNRKQQRSRLRQNVADDAEEAEELRAESSGRLRPRHPLDENADDADEEFTTASPNHPLWELDERPATPRRNRPARAGKRHSKRHLLEESAALADEPDRTDPPATEPDRRTAPDRPAHNPFPDEDDVDRESLESLNLSQARISSADRRKRMETYTIPLSDRRGIAP